MKINTLLIVLIAVVFYYLLTRNNKEGLQNVQDYKKELASEILEFMSPDAKYGDYLQFLIQKKNRSYKLLDNEVFTEFRLLSKKNILTLGDILLEMDDVE